MSMEWKVGQTVDVQSRTWAGINKPGGCAKIIKVHYSEDGKNVESLDVKYVLGGGREKEIDPAIVSAYKELDRGGRKRRGREFLMDRAEDVVKKVQNVVQSATTSTKNMISSRHKKKARPSTPRTTRDMEQSTSPSTPVTPEHPSQYPKAKKVKRASAPSAKTDCSSSFSSVPTFVVADNPVEVSPLALDRAISDKQKPSDVRRGLFGNPSSATDPSKNKKAKLDAKDSKARTQASSQIAKSTSKSNSHQEKATKSVPVLSASQEIPSQSLKTAKAKMSDRATSIHQLSKPKKNAASKPSKAFAVAAGSGIGTQKALKEVFDYEVRKAREFLDEVCRAPHPDPEEVAAKPAAAPHPQTTKRNQFLSIFRALRPKFDDEDGTMDETTFRKAMIAKSDNGFTEADVNEHLQYLCNNGKLMQSDGMLYIID